MLISAIFSPRELNASAYLQRHFPPILRCAEALVGFFF
jgi:hypothetical protein